MPQEGGGETGGKKRELQDPRNPVIGSKDAQAAFGHLGLSRASGATGQNIFSSLAGFLI